MKIKNKINVEEPLWERERERERDFPLLFQDSYNEFEDKHSIKEEKRKLNAKKKKIVIYVCINIIYKKNQKT